MQDRPFKTNCNPSNFSSFMFSKKRRCLWRFVTKESFSCLTNDLKKKRYLKDSERKVFLFEFYCVHHSHRRTIQEDFKEITTIQNTELAQFRLRNQKELNEIIKYASCSVEVLLIQKLNCFWIWKPLNVPRNCAGEPIPVTLTGWTRTLLKS